MRLYMKQHVFTWSDRFSVYDETGNEVYTAQAELFSIGHRMHLYKYGEKIGYIEEQILTFMPRFKMYLKENYLGELAKKFTLFHQHYELNYQDWYVDGNYFALDYATYDALGNEVMRVAKEMFTWGDSYCLEIHDSKNEEICVMIMLAIDCALCSAQ